MGNYESREKQLVIEANDMFKKINEQNNITKKNLISLNEKLKKLKKINKKQWRNLANRSNTIMRQAIGLNPRANFIKFTELYSDFQKNT